MPEQTPIAFFADQHETDAEVEGDPGFTLREDLREYISDEHEPFEAVSAGEVAMNALQIVNERRRHTIEAAAVALTGLGLAVTGMLVARHRSQPHTA